MSKRRYDWIRDVYGELADAIKLAEEMEWWSIDIGPDAPKTPEEGNASLVRSEDQDCFCTTHTGPHWKHMDNLWHESNLKLLETAMDSSVPYQQRELAFGGFAQEEEQRLREKLFYMRLESDKLNADKDEQESER